MSPDPGRRRSVRLTRRDAGHYTATNARGGELHFGSGQDQEFTPVELLLAAIGGCSSVDVDLVTSRRSEPEQFELEVSADKGPDETGGSRLHDVVVDFQLRFPDDEAGRRAASMVERLVRLSRDKDCTVSRTVEAPTEVEFRLGGTPLD